MNRNIICAVFAALLCVICICPGMAENQESIAPDISATQVQFIENAGQAHEEILYQVKAPEFSFDFTKDSLLVSGPSDNCEECNTSISSPVVVTVAGALDDVTVEAFDQLPGYANFLFGSNESEWQTHVPWYGGIRYVNILPGIDLMYAGKDGILKREFFVHEGADPGAIRLLYGGSEGLLVAEDGSLQVSTSFGDLTELAPYTYQEIDGATVEIDSSYFLYENGEIGYIIGEYDPAYPLVIDPSLEYSTLLGGSLEDYGMDIALDPFGDVYVTGYTSSCDFPLINPIKDNTISPKFNGTYCHNSRDVFVTKIGVGSTGNATIRFSTYLGGEKADFGRGIAVDSIGNIYICGDTFSEDFPVKYPFSYGGFLHGSNDAFVTKLMKDGTGIYWSDLLGGNFADQANDIALDSLNAVYLTGQTVGNSPYKALEKIFPVTDYAYQTSPNPNAVMGDAFAVKISPSGQTLEYSTYISGSGQDVGNGIAVDGQGMAYVVGTTSSSNLLPPGVEPYQENLKGGQDAFLFKMNFQAGVPPVYATYLGGETGYDYGQAVAVDSAFSAYVTGATASKYFPVTNQAMQTVKGWPYDTFEKDAFVTKFNTEGDSLIYSTYLGGTKDDWGYDIKVDSKFRAHVTGYSRSTQIPRSGGMIGTIKQASGGQDGFLTMIKSDGRSAESSTFFGGFRDDVSHAVAITPDGNTSYVTGYTSSPTMQNLICGIDCESEAFPTYKWINQDTYWGWNYNGGNFTGNYQGSFDAFVLKFGQQTLNPSFTASPTCGAADPGPNLTVTFTDTSTGIGNILNKIWNFGDGTLNTTGSVPMVVSHNYTDPGTYQATLVLQTYTGALVSDPKTITFCRDDISANFTVADYNNTADPIPVPFGTDITFKGYALNYTADSYSWQWGDGMPNGTGQTAHHVFDRQGIFTVNMTAPTGTCCDTETNVKGSKNIRVFKKPEARFVNHTSTPRDGCAPLEVRFTDTSLGGTTYGQPTAWQWNFGDNTNNATVQNPTHTYVNPGTYTVTLTASNIAGSSTYSRKNYVKVGGVVDPGFIASPLAGDAPLRVQFTDKSEGAPTSWRWDFGDGSAFNYTQNPYHIYTKAGVYSVNLEVDNECTDPAVSENFSDYITVNANMTPKILFGNNSPVYNTLPVYGPPVLNVTFLGDTFDGTLIDGAIWKFGDEQTQIQNRSSGWPANNNWFNTSHLYPTIGNYTPVLEVYNETYDRSGLSGNLYKDYVGVYPPLIVNFTVDPPAGIVGQSITFTDHSEGLPVNWTWNFRDGKRTTGVPSTSHIFTTSAKYEVILAITNKYGATSLGTKEVVIDEADTDGVVSFIPQNITLVTGDSNYRVINVQLNKADFGLSSYKMKIDLDSSTDIQFRDYAVRPTWLDGEYFTHTVSPTKDSITISGMKSSGMLPPGSKNISLGNISLTGISAGDAVMSLNLTKSSALNGVTPLSLTGIPAQVHAYDVSPLPGQTNRPTDIRPTGIHDGLIDDFDGNGNVNTADVTLFFNEYSTTGYFDSAPVPPFDYHHNDVINFKDIQRFFDMFW
ncbi:MAG: PKD domain-containing protein [Methanomicrobiales archaeon]|nr:PKD domain-containing protein [Methanomicrobiales archaeon]